MDAMDAIGPAAAVAADGYRLQIPHHLLRAFAEALASIP